MIYGVAINDLSNHKTQLSERYKDENGEPRRRVLWQCPFYTKWFNMLTRCYSEKEMIKHPTYEKVYVSDDWLLFSNFKNWMEKQDWLNKNLDKDILFPGNLEYAEDKCVFVSKRVNNFLIEKRTNKRDLPIGVSYHKSKKKFIAAISCGRHFSSRQLGAFDDPDVAHLRWAEEKLKMATEIAASENEKVATALILRYTKIYNDALSKVGG